PAAAGAGPAEQRPRRPRLDRGRGGAIAPVLGCLPGRLLDQSRPGLFTEKEPAAATRRGHPVPDGGGGAASQEPRRAPQPGQRAADKGQVDRAIACYQKATALDPKYAVAHNNLGNALYGKGKVAEAIACYHKAIALDPKDAYAHNNLGAALKAKGHMDE